MRATVRGPATGSPDELIERNANYLCLTLKAADARASETIRRLHFEPVRDNRNNIKVRVRNTEDVQTILDAIKGAGMPLPGLDVRKPNLEEVYLGLTGSALREDAVAGAAT